VEANRDAILLQVSSMIRPASRGVKASVEKSESIRSHPRLKLPLSSEALAKEDSRLNPPWLVNPQ